MSVAKLNTIRDEHSQPALNSNSSNSATPAPFHLEPNRVDTIIADVFSLVSLFFLAVGKTESRQRCTARLPACV
jgi:hypothetical protein